MAVDAQRLTRGVGARWQTVRRRYKWWQLTLFVIGVITAITLFSALFFAVGDKPGRIYTDTAPPPVDSAHFSTALSTIVGAPVEHGGTITMLNNGDQFVPALLDAIAHAERTINFAVYIWSEGQFSDQLLAALVKKQREGVTVRVLLDGLGSIKVPDEDFEPLVDGRRQSRRNSGPRSSASSLAFTAGTIAARSSSTAKSGLQAAWPCPTSGWETRRIPSTGATSCSR